MVYVSWRASSFFNLLVFKLLLSVIISSVSSLWKYYSLLIISDHSDSVSLPGFFEIKSSTFNSFLTFHFGFIDFFLVRFSFGLERILQTVFLRCLVLNGYVYIYWCMFCQCQLVILVLDSWTSLAFSLYFTSEANICFKMYWHSPNNIVPLH